MLKISQYHIAFPVAKFHKESLKKELDRPYKLGVLKTNIDSIWAAPTFNVPKKNAMV